MNAGNRNETGLPPFQIHGTDQFRARQHLRRDGKLYGLESPYRHDGGDFVRSHCLFNEPDESASTPVSKIGHILTDLDYLFRLPDERSGRGT